MAYFNLKIGSYMKILKSILSSIAKSTQQSNEINATTPQIRAKKRLIYKTGVSNIGVAKSLIDIARPEDVNIIPTTKCNLRCEYCTASGKHADQKLLKDISDTNFQKISKQILTNHPNKHMILSGGEVTFMKNWTVMVKNLKEDGFPVLMITNFAKIMSDAEIECLVGLSQIMISIDTPDIDLAKFFRSKTQMENIVFNIVRVRSFCALRDVRVPPLSFHCTLGAQTVRTLPELVSLAHTCGVPHVHINEVTMHGDLAYEYKPVTSFSELDQNETLAVFNTAFNLASRLGVNVSVVAGLLDAIKNPSNVQPPKGMTRLCFDPWKMLLIGVDGDICTCCNGYPPVAKLNEVSNLDDIFFSEKNNKCKVELMTGNLSPECIKCTRRNVVTLEEFEFELEDFLTEND